MSRSERGYTIVEVLVAMALFSVVTTTFYYLLFAVRESSGTATSVSNVSQEARQGLNRMVRDTREASELVAVDTNISDNKVSYTIDVDFDGNNVITTSGPNTGGDAERLTFAFNKLTGTITLNGEVLAEGIECPTAACEIFRYSSNRLQFDWTPDGVVTWDELDEAGCAARGSYSVGNCNDLFDSELSEISNVDIALKVRDGDSVSDFYVQAQLRNMR
ncbi:MAG TPA: prepilin-type N-terminal cleavage/methylation domain-containing protein [Actinomycetota bacterium]|nr:prepilin-type N-terminal cleavage/methylation domain-containing protein [Actinomycetota bacterium]